MGDHARGDCKTVICSSDEEELQQEVYNNSLHFTPTTVVLMSRLNIRDKRNPTPGTSGEANYFAKPAVPIPPIADDTDRQFWAEDEMSSSESRLRLVCKQRRRHSLAYRNRVAIRKRSRSLLCQSSSSNSDPAVQLEIISPATRCNVRRRRKCNHRQGPSATKKAKAGNNVSAFRTPTPRPSPDSKIPNSSTVGAGIRFQFGIQQPNSRRRMQAPYIPAARRRSRSRRSQTPNLPCSSNVHPKNNASDVAKCKNENLRPPSTSKRK